MTKKKRIRLFLLLNFLVIYITLAATLIVDKIQKENGDKTPIKIEENIVFEDIQQPYKYIFIRLYDVDYIHPLTPANFLQLGVECTEVSNIQACHVAINFSLEDNFYGLTSGGEYQLAQESCINTASNKFMKKCDPDNSSVTVYALKVTEEEYNNTKKMVESYATGSEIKYDLFQDFKIALFSIDRKFFTEPSEQKFGSMKYPVPISSDKVLDNLTENRFVCSTFVAYCLMENIPKIHKWFKEKNINYKYVNVTDVVNIPGVNKLFSCTYTDYENASREFIERYPEFSSYFN